MSEKRLRSHYSAPYPYHSYTIVAPLPERYLWNSSSKILKVSGFEYPRLLRGYPHRRAGSDKNVTVNCGRNVTFWEIFGRFRSKICAEKTKKPHKIEKMHNLHKKFWKLCSCKPLIYKGKVPFCTNAQFSKTFCDKIFSKSFLALICVNRVKIDYYSHIPRKVAYTNLKSNLCKLCKPAITNAF
jgi:hypothetical protein